MWRASRSKGLSLSRGKKGVRFQGVSKGVGWKSINWGQFSYLVIIKMLLKNILIISASILSISAASYGDVATPVPSPAYGPAPVSSSTTEDSSSTTEVYSSSTAVSTSTTPGSGTPTSSAPTPTCTKEAERKRHEEERKRREEARRKRHHAKYEARKSEYSHKRPRLSKPKYDVSTHSASPTTTSTSSEYETTQTGTSTATSTTTAVAKPTSVYVAPKPVGYSTPKHY